MRARRMQPDDLLELLRRFQQEGVEYILVGGHAVRLNGFVRATEDIDILLPSSLEPRSNTVQIRKRGTG
jgi:hypothetical protein